jgi:hypothetical protein
MNIGKKYTKISEGKDYTITNIEGSFYILNDGVKISAERLTDTNTYLPVNESSDFFNSANNAIASVFMKAPSQPSYNDNVTRIEAVRKDIDYDDEPISNNIDDIDKAMYANSNNVAVVYGDEDPEYEKRKLLEKYNISPNNVAKSVAQQNAMMSKLLEDDLTISDLDPVKHIEPQKRVESIQQPMQQVTVEDPIISLLNKTKRVNKFKGKIDIEEMLPKNEFIQMLEESYDNSIVEYLADEIVNKLIQDHGALKEQIKKQIFTFINKKTKKSI